jgi:hypothetical protein
MKNYFSKVIIASAVLFCVSFYACKKEDSNITYNGGGSNPPPSGQVFIQSNMFNPSSVNVSKGTTVTWTNKDNTTHTVTSKTNLFDSGDMSGGKVFSHTFPDAGTFTYYCKYHSGMNGTVVVQ